MSEDEDRPTNPGRSDEERAQWAYDHEIRALYPDLPPVRWWTNPALTRGNAYATFDGTNIEIQLRENPGSIKPAQDYVVWHESGHILAFARAGQYPDLYEHYKRERGLPGPVVNSAEWVCLTQEQFADDFCYSHIPQGGHWPASKSCYGSELDVERMRGFFAALAARTLPRSEVTMTKHHSDPAGHLLRYPVTSPFGPRPGLYGDFHRGCDFGTPEGTKIYAVRGGTVSWDDDQVDGYEGISVWVDCGDGERWGYAHLLNNVVAGGQRVARGQLIGYSGATGAATGPHMHVQRSRNGVDVDPWEELMALSDEGKAEIRQIVQEELARATGAGSVLLGEIVGAIKGGFNDALPAFLNRLARGDKDVRDADVDGVATPPA